MRDFRLAAATASGTFVLLLVGGTVNPTGSSLACPDWPWCYGSFFPEMTGGVQYEHTHRVVAGFVALTTFVLTVLVWRHRHARRVRYLALAASGMVLLQAVLGGLTVLLKLPTAISVAHLALSMLFFSTMLVLTYWIGTEEPSRVEPEDRRGSGVSAARRWVGIGAVLVYLQILLGGLVRHTGAGLACGDSIPFCYGDLWPAWAPAQLNMAHRWVGVALAVVLLPAVVSTARAARRTGRRMAGRLSLFAIPLVLVQIGLGLLTVHTSIGVVPVTAHLGVGALLLCTLVLTFLGLGPRRVAVSERVATPLQEVTA